MGRTFLQAEWRKLVMVNYAVDPRVLAKHLPHKTEVELWNNVCYLSLVGFMFQNTRLLGIKIPLHINFEEVNLRFYVRHKENGEWKRGVVFIKEIVPKPALTWVANAVYKEKYETMPMKHSWTAAPDSLKVGYRWRKGGWNSISVTTDVTSMLVQPGSEEEFITEHYWGYSRGRDSVTYEYRVDHPKWEVYRMRDYAIDVEFGEVYGREFNFLNRQKPKSVFLAEGSGIKVMSGKRIN
jgi:uncharacterized protein YqjF (DUF2071 family)